MRSSRNPERDHLPESRREDAPEEKTSAEMSSIEHFLRDYARVGRPPTPTGSRR